MLNTVASIVTGIMIVTSPLVNEPTSIEVISSPTTEVMDSFTNISYGVNVNTSLEELEDIRAAAIEAGMGFNYKKRGVKTRLVIDMIIETEDDYDLERIVIKEEDGTKFLNWTVNADGEAIAFERTEADTKEF